MSHYFDHLLLLLPRRQQHIANRNVFLRHCVFAMTVYTNINSIKIGSYAAVVTQSNHGDGTLTTADIPRRRVVAAAMDPNTALASVYTRAVHR